MQIEWTIFENFPAILSARQISTEMLKRLPQKFEFYSNRRFSDFSLLY